MEGLDGAVSQAGQDVSQVVADGDFEPAATFDHRQNCRHASSRLLASYMDPIFPAKSYRAHGVFGQVIAQFQLRVLQEELQSFP